MKPHIQQIGLLWWVMPYKGSDTGVAGLTQACAWTEYKSTFISETA